MVFEGEVLLRLLEVEEVLNLSTFALCSVATVYLLPEGESVLGANAEGGSSNLDVCCFILSVRDR